MLKTVMIYAAAITFGAIPIVFSRQMAEEYIDRQIKKGRSLAITRERDLRTVRWLNVIVGAGILGEIAWSGLTDNRVLMPSFELIGKSVIPIASGLYALLRADKLAHWHVQRQIQSGHRIDDPTRNEASLRGLNIIVGITFVIFGIWSTFFS